MADHRIELPEGHWADLRDPRKITRGNRKPIRAAMLRLHRYRQDLQEWATAVAEQQAAAANPGILGVVPIGIVPTTEADDAPVNEDGTEATVTYLPNEEEVEMLDVLQEAVTVALVVDWSFDGGVSVAMLNDMPADCADALIEHCSTFIDQIFVNTEPNDDEDSPTTP